MLSDCTKPLFILPNTILIQLAKWSFLLNRCSLTRVTMSSCFPTCILSNDHSVLCEVDPFPPPVLVTASPPLSLSPSFRPLSSMLFHAAAKCHGLEQANGAYVAEDGTLVERTSFHCVLETLKKKIPGPAHTVGFRLILPWNLPCQPFWLCFQLRGTGRGAQYSEAGWKMSTVACFLLN